MSGKHLAFALCATLCLLLAQAAARAQKKVFLNPSNQTSNSVTGGGHEAQYALIVANKTKAILAKAGLSVTVDQSFTNSPKNANSWGADIFVSIHTNAGGGHGTETLYVSSGGKTLAGKVQNGLLSKLPYQSRGLKKRTDLYVLNKTSMYACLLESVFHDCAKTSGYTGHPPSESSFLRSTAGRDKIAAGIAAGVCSYYGVSCSGTTPPSKGWIKGVVYKSPNLTDRISGAAVKLNTGQTATSASNGAWSFQVAPGSYTVTASKAGYKTGTSKGTVTAGTETWASVGLTPATAKPDSGPPVKDAALPDSKQPDTGPQQDATPRLDSGSSDGPSGDAMTTVPPGPEEACGCGVGEGHPGALALMLALVLLGIRRRRG